MADTINVATPQPTDVTPPPAQVTFLQFTQQYFAVLSGIAVVGGAGLATIFLYAYLSVFDWHLLWIVQYPDIITFALVAIGVIGGSFTLIYSIISTILSADQVGGKFKSRALIGAGFLAACLFGFQLYAEHMAVDPRYRHLWWGWASLSAGVLLILLTIRLIRLGKWPTARQFGGILVLMFLATSAFGQWLAYAVLQSPYYEQDVYLKNQTLNKAKVVLIMSHHTILLVNQELYIVPTADITQIKTPLQPYMR